MDLEAQLQSKTSICAGVKDADDWLPVAAAASENLFIQLFHIARSDFLLHVLKCSIGKMSGLVGSDCAEDSLEL